MPFLVYLLLLILYLVSGLGILQLFGLRLKPAYTITLSLLLGIALASFLPFLLQLLYIPLTGFTVFGVLTLAAILLSIPTVLRIRREGPGGLRTTLVPAHFQVQPYEIPFWVIIGFLIFVSVWRCYYLPPTSRDALSGPEAIAEFAYREHTLINSFFKVDLWSTNNQFKSPFLICLQLIYKLAGFPFGQVWLSPIFIGLIVFLYNALREKVHPIIVGILLLLFIMTPETYAYTFMILYDYSNMVYMFLGLYFLFAYFSAGDKRNFYFAGLLIGIATYIRSETLALALLFLPPMIIAQRREKLPWKKIAISGLLFFLPAFIGYYLPNGVYIQHYLPVHYDVGALVNSNLGDVSPLFKRYGDIVNRLLVSGFAIKLWCYIFFVTAALFVAEAVFVRRFTREALNWLYAIGILYVGLGLLGWVLPVVDLNDTTKRGMFKMLPLCLMYLANNTLLIRLSQTVSRWELTPALPKVAGKPALAAGRSVLTRSGKTVAASGSGPGKGASAVGKTAPASGKTTPATSGSRRKRKK
ncbi:MAG TPA: hypothetical protein VGS79_00830 [Puia sp.]|nr:hypothetical protein [Puia sp.]